MPFHFICHVLRESEWLSEWERERGVVTLPGVGVGGGGGARGC